MSAGTRRDSSISSGGGRVTRRSRSAHSQAHEDASETDDSVVTPQSRGALYRITSDGNVSFGAEPRSSLDTIGSSFLKSYDKKDQDSTYSENGAPKHKDQVKKMKSSPQADVSESEEEQQQRGSQADERTVPSSHGQTGHTHGAHGGKTGTESTPSGSVRYGTTSDGEISFGAAVLHSPVQTPSDTEEEPKKMFSSTPINKNRRNFMFFDQEVSPVRPTPTT